MEAWSFVPIFVGPMLVNIAGS